MVYGFRTEESIALQNLHKLSTSSPGGEKRATLKEVKELGGFRVSDRHRPFLPTPVQLMCSAGQPVWGTNKVGRSIHFPSMSSVSVLAT